MAERRLARWTVSGVVEAPVDQVAGLLLDLNPGLAGATNAVVLASGSVADQGPISLQGGPRHFTATIGQPAVASIDVEVDREARRLTLQGHWWYRGVHSVERHERGTLLTHRVYNIASPTTRWLVPLMQRRQPATMRQDLDRLLATIGDRLGCAAYRLGA